MTLSLKWANLHQFVQSARLNPSGYDLSNIGLETFGTITAGGMGNSGGTANHPLANVFGLPRDVWGWSPSGQNSTGYMVRTVGAGTDWINSFYLRPGESGGFQGTLRGMVPASSSQAGRSSGATGIWLHKDRVQTDIWELSVTPNSGTMYTATVDISKLPPIQWRYNGPPYGSYLTAFRKVDLCGFNISNGSTTWKVQLWIDDVKVAEHTYASTGNTAWGNSPVADMVYVYQAAGASGASPFPDVQYINDLLWTGAESDLPTPRYMLTGNLIQAATASGWDTTDGTGHLEDGSSATGVRETSTSTLTVTINPRVTTSDTIYYVDFTQPGLFVEKPPASGSATPYMPYIWAAMNMRRGSGSNADRTWRIKDSDGTSLYTDSAIALTTADAFFLASPSGKPGNPIINNASKGPGSFEVTHNGSGSDSYLTEAVLIGLVRILGPYRVAAASSIGIAGATVTQGQQEHFTSLTVDATAAATLAQPIKAATIGPVAIDATGAIAAIANVEFAAGPLAVDAASSATIAASSVDHIVGPLAQAATAALTVGIPLKEATTLLTVDAASSLVVAASTREIPAGAFTVDATSSVVVVDATVSPGFTEHFTSLTVDATAAATVQASTLERFTGALAQAATAAVDIAAAARDALTSLAVAASSSLTVVSWLREAFSGPLASSGSSALTIANSAREALTSLALSSSSSLVVGLPLNETTTVLTVDGAAALTVVNATVSTAGTAGPFDISAISALTVSTPSLEATTALTVDATGAATIATSTVETQAGPVVIASTGATTIVAATKEAALGALALASSASLTIAAPTREVLAGPLAVSSSSSATIAASSRDAVTALAVNSSSALVIAGTLVEGQLGALALGATAALTVVDATASGATQPGWAQTSGTTWPQHTNDPWT